MARNRSIPVRSGDKGSYMAKRKTQNRKRNRWIGARGDAAKCNSQRTSKRETSDSKEPDSSQNSEERIDSYSTSMKERVRRILEEFYRSSVLSDAVELSACIIEREKDGMLAYELTVNLSPLKRSHSNSLAEVIENGKHLTLCEFYPWGARRNSGDNDGTSCSRAS